MRQRVLIAIALACEPDLLIADEPTSALDVTVQRRILDHLESLRAARGTSLLLVTHDLGLAADRADRIVVMSQGEIVEAGPAEQILRDPQHEYTRRLVAAAPSVTTSQALFAGPRGARDDQPPGRRRVRRRRPDGEVDPGGRRPGQGVPRPGPQGAADRGRRRLLHARAPGTTTAIVGESGSGKTTVARMVARPGDARRRARCGSAARQVETARGAARRAIRRAMQPVFQDPYASLNPTFTIEHIVDEPLRVFSVGDRASRRAGSPSCSTRSPCRRPSPSGTPTSSPAASGSGSRSPGPWPLEPRLMVCDEAVSALDVLVQDQILRLLADLQRDLGLSYLFITHDLAVVRMIADDVLVMQQGRVVESGRWTTSSRPPARTTPATCWRRSPAPPSSHEPARRRGAAAASRGHRRRGLRRPGPASPRPACAVTSRCPACPCARR